MLKLRLLLAALRHAAALAEELLQTGRQALHLALLHLILLFGRLIFRASARGDRDVDDRRADPRGDSLHGLIERRECIDALLRNRACSTRGGVDTGVSDEERGTEGNGTGEGEGSGDRFSVGF